MTIANTPNHEIISMIGDSIAFGMHDADGIGWAGRLVQKLNQKTPAGFYLQNNAVDTFRSSDCLHALMRLLIKPGRFLFVATGVNDVQRLGSPDAPTNLSTAESLYNFGKIIKAAKLNYDKIAVFDILPVNEAKIPYRKNRAGMDIFWRNSDIRTLNNAVRALCQQENILYVECHDGFAQQDLNDFILEEVHPSKAGHVWLAEHIHTKLEPWLRS